MDIFVAYIFTFCIIFILMPFMYYLLRFTLWIALDLCGCSSSYNEYHQQNEESRRTTFAQIYDRQGNIFTIADESGNNALQHRCSDFFYVEQNAEDAARIRAQLEKDEKDLPTYEEVMAMSLAQAQAGSLATHNASNTSVTAATHVPVPPYSQVSNPAPTSPVVTNVSSTTSAIPIVHNGATVWPKLTCPVTSSGDASTSRAAAAAATTTLTTVTITNSVSNTSV
ncbi:uncharacterized protein [Eurosta solidaginis]|uniref:uncharacterized protein isoform X3 n=1 Tax=Eurosta solidaginis TaxID=178769 RepID=UPI00353164FD